MENLRKRQLSPISTTEPKKPAIVDEPIDDDELPLKIVEDPVENPPKHLNLDEFPILKSMISAPIQKSSTEATSKTESSGDENGAEKKKNPGYLQVYSEL